MKFCIIYGGVSTEHEVSVWSTKSICDNIDKDKYKIKKAFISKEGIWYDEHSNEIENVMAYLKQFDVIFPMLHGLYGEDGTIQGLFEMINVPYVGCKVLSSSICMDKGYANLIFDQYGISQCKYIYAKKYKTSEYLYFDENNIEHNLDIDELIEITIKKIKKFPMFVKPSNSGSSVGITKVYQKEDLKKAILYALKFDNKILIEEGIIGREVEIAILGSNETGYEVSTVGEIISAEDFYTYSAKYENEKSKVIIPAKIDKKVLKEIQMMAEKAFKAVDGSGLARIDFFIQEGTNKVYLNEINTMPGFTNISMYPSLMMDYGYTYSEIIDKLIELAIKSK